MPSVRLTPLKTPSNWAIFTTELILRLKTSVMSKNVKRVWENDTLITVWED
jgi:hypothetical protein